MKTNNDTPTNARGYTAAQQAILAEIITIALSTPSRIADVNVSVATHADCVDVHCYGDGWKPGALPDFKGYAYLGRETIGETLGLTLEKLRDELKSHLVKLASKEGGK